MNRRVVAHVLLGAWIWAFCYSYALASSAFKDDMRVYDMESLGWAALMALFGGALRTIYTLATDVVLVRSVWREALKDAVVAIIAGIVCHIAIEAVDEAWHPVAHDLRFAIIVFAGWSRTSFFGAAQNMASRVVEAFTARMVRQISGTPPSPPPKKEKPFKEKS